MKTIEVSDQEYEALANAHGDVTAFVQRMAAEAEEVAAVMKGVEDYHAGRHQSLEDFGRDISSEFGINLDT